VQVNIAIRRTFVHRRALLATREDLRRKIEQMEKRHDGKFSAVFATLKPMLEVPVPRKKEIGFHARPGTQKYSHQPSITPHKTLQIKALFIHKPTSST
jgi:rubrerythrin